MSKKYWTYAAFVGVGALVVYLATKYKKPETSDTAAAGATATTTPKTGLRAILVR